MDKNESDDELELDITGGPKIEKNIFNKQYKKRLIVILEHA